MTKAATSKGRGTGKVATETVDPINESSNQTAEHGIVRANANRHEMVSPEFVSLYTNDTQLLMTPWDLRLVFGEISRVAVAEDGNRTIEVTQKGEVRMSPQHAKRIVLLLVQQLRHYEDHIGKIPLPSD